jgi:hypothetical protein
MTGFIQDCMRSWRRRSLLRPDALAAAILCLAILVAAGQRAWAQEEDEDTSMDETSLRKQQPKKAASEVLPPPPGMKISTHLDRTAVWVGDQFHYLITVSYSPDFEFVIDNITKETVNLDPLQVMDVSKKISTLKDNSRRLDVDLTLASFATAQTSMTIPQYTLYYFRKDKKTTSAEQAAAESLTVPGPVLALRSTLPPDPSDLRDAITITGWDRVRWVLPGIGYACGIVLIIGLALEGVTFIKQRKTRKGPDRRKAMEAVRARWVSSVPSDFSDPKIAESFYSDSYQKLKEFIGYYLEAPTMGLTAEEMDQEMQRLGARPDLTQKVVKILNTCESLRYSENGVAHADSARAIAQDMRDILSTKD